MEFSNKVVIVTGSGRGIGRGIAQRYASEGAMVVIAEKDTFNRTETERAINSSGGTALFIRTDVSDPSQIKKMVRLAVEQAGIIDILINNAGISEWKSSYEITVEEWDNIRVNCISLGWIETGDYGKLRDIDHKQHLSGRVGKPEDIAEACIYLTKKSNDFINGANIINYRWKDDKEDDIWTLKFYKAIPAGFICFPVNASFAPQ